MVRLLTYVVMRKVTCAEYWSKRPFGLRIPRLCVNVHSTSLPINLQKVSLITSPVFNGSCGFSPISDLESSVS